MIVIIEGPDGAGKTTLGKELEKRALIPLYRRSLTPLVDQTVAESNAMNEAALGVALAANMDVTFDRSYPSEWVYSRVMGRELSDDHVLALDEMCRESGNVKGILLSYATTADAWNRYDHHIQAEQLKQANQLYGQWLSVSKLEWLSLDASLSREKIIELSMKFLRKHRGSMASVFMNIAHDVAERSTCLSRRVGAVLVNEKGHVIATGYNGAPSGCAPMEKCERLQSGAESGSQLHLCNDVHAEENCIVQAGRNGASTVNSTLYTTLSPCNRCMRMLINAGVEAVWYAQAYQDEMAMSLAEEAEVKVEQL